MSIACYDTAEEEWENRRLSACLAIRFRSASRAFYGSRAGPNVVYPHKGKGYFSRRVTLSEVFDPVCVLVHNVVSHLQ